MQDNQAVAVKSEVENSKKNTGMIAGMVALAVIALGGVGFGIGQTISANNQLAAKDSEIASLKVKTTSPNGTKTEMEAETVTVTSPDGTVTEIAETPAVNTKDYIYIGEWGMKIKIPDGLKSVTYTYRVGNAHTTLFVSGVECGSGQCQYYPDFADQNKNHPSMGALMRVVSGIEPSSITASANLGILVFSDDNYEYYYSGPQAVYSLDEDEKKWEGESTYAVQQMLLNPENYSRI